ncbi:unnamed protein product [Protopolystoma xenopodis]|uniref:Cyclic nucleotide-binding domain-containing protein n=1 Tax=Protopolystoma xenopodis TaxID=117903 RepID=A0A3S4ZXZ3_9PLAT|nr:unnamed protein product [Protopolystoma xenopodis]
MDSQYILLLSVLDAGKSFGELALINPDCIRNATIISDCSAHLLSVQRELFNQCLRTAQTAEFQAKLDFVRSCEFFNKWNPRLKRQAAMSLRKGSFRFNQFIIRQGEPVNGIAYIIR